MVMRMEREWVNRTEERATFGRIVKVTLYWMSTSRKGRVFRRRWGIYHQG